jgi:hypothetical protein
VRKEFYQLVTRQLLDPGYGMFKKMEEARCIWFNSDSLESDQVTIANAIRLLVSLSCNLCRPLSSLEFSSVLLFTTQ